MTPQPSSIDTTSATVVGLIVGVFTGLSLCGCLFGAAGYAWVKKAEADARRGWNLVPVVVVMDRARAAGEVLAMEDIAQRSVPEQFVTSSVVKPDSASYVVGQLLAVPVAKGEPLRWSDFADARALKRADDKSEYDACLDQLRAKDGAPAVSTVDSARAAVLGKQAP